MSRSDALVQSPTDLSRSVEEASLRIVYPEARKDGRFEEMIHGYKIKDVYRWLEDPDSVDTQQFVNAQNNISQSFLERSAERENINSKLTKLWNYPKYGCPMRHGNYYYFF